MPEPAITLNVLLASHMPQSILPQKAHPLDAGFDLAIPEDTTIPSQAHLGIDLGFAMQIPPGWYGQIFGRSSVFRRGLFLHPGVIDADYRGTVQLLIYNLLPHEQRVHRGDRLAQLLILPVPGVALTHVSPQELSRTARGSGGIGSTGR